MQKEYAQIGCYVKRLLHEKHGEKNKKGVVLLAHDDDVLYKLGPKNAHRKHPVVLWACKSMAHFMWVVDLGIQLAEEKRNRIENMMSPDFPSNKRPKKPWSLKHKSQAILQHLKTNSPPLEWFENGNDWTDPPKCVPACYHNDAHGEPFDVVQTYRLCYSGHKRVVTKLTWLPFVEIPEFMEDCVTYIQSRPDILEVIETDRIADEEQKLRDKERRKEKRELKKLKDEEQKTEEIPVSSQYYIEEDGVEEEDNMEEDVKEEDVKEEDIIDEGVVLDLCESDDEDILILQMKEKQSNHVKTTQSKHVKKMPLRKKRQRISNFNDVEDSLEDQ